MASVFLSYDREDAGKARPVALALEKAGHSVWWDLHVRGGAQFSKVIEEALKASDAVVVLWSEHSVESAWVRDEAAAGRDSGRLVPVSLDMTEPPLGFRQYQTIDMSRWKRGRSPELQELLHAVEALGGKPVSDKGPAPPVAAAAAERKIPLRPLLIGVVILAMIAAGLVFWRPWGQSASVPVVAVAAADRSAGTQALARDLLIKLGGLQAADAGTMRLVAQNDSRAKPNLILEVAGSNQAGQAESSLALFDARDRVLLWSKDFEQTSGNQADLRQQLAYTAARVLDCALEGLSTTGKRLDEQTLNLYLNGCSSYAEQSDPRALVSIFRDVTTKAPDFEGGWAKLLLVETEVVSSFGMDDDARAMRPSLQPHIVAARRLNPNMAEAFLAEAALLPPGDFRQRMDLLERAVDSDPGNADVLMAYSQALMRVGRLDDAVEQSRRAKQVDPLSPATSDALISALTYDGRLDAALEELRQADQLWPGASNLLEARYRLHLRYGDPHEALRIQRLRSSEPSGEDHRVAFLRARLDRSPENIEKAVARPRHWLRTEPGAIGELAQVYGAFGKEEELFSILLHWPYRDRVNYVTEVLFRPALRNVHRDPRMMAVANRIGLVDYWRQSGEWPDFCFEPDLPYDCKAEAAKLAAGAN